MCSTAEKKIIEYLERCDEEQNPYMISRNCHINYDYTRHLLSKLSKEERIARPRRGWYLSKNAIFVKPSLPMRPLKLHGLKIITRKRQGLPFVTSSDFIKMASIDIHRHRINHSLTYDEEWRSRLITLTLHESGTLIIDLKSSQNPVNFSEFDAFCGWLEGRFPLIPLEAWTVLQAGLNWDLLGFKLDGMSSITLRILHDMWLRLYQKSADLLRVEAHVNVGISLPEMLNVMQGALENLDAIVEKKVIVPEVIKR